MRLALSNALTQPRLVLGGGAITVTGGTVVDYTDGGTDYRAHIFNSSGDLTISGGDLDVEYLIVAGGGSGGSSRFIGGGGGGAGGLRKFVVGEAGNTEAGVITLTPGTYPAVIGSGGAAPLTNTAAGSKGLDSSALGLTSDGGGAGRDGGFITASVDGGSGGAYGGSSDSDFGTGIAGQGNDSGVGSGGATNAERWGGGGGGAGSAGGDGTLTGGGAGGAGKDSSITGTLVTYASGGDGSVLFAPSNEPANSGNGSTGTKGNIVGADGGSGIVVVRYPLPAGK